jgi:hypothetical protein
MVITVAGVKTSSSSRTSPSARVAATKRDKGKQRVYDNPPQPSPHTPTYHYLIFHNFYNVGNEVANKCGMMQPTYLCVLQAVFTHVTFTAEEWQKILGYTL